MSNIKCIIVDDEPTARDIIKIHIEQIHDIEIVAICKNAIEAINALNNHTVDLIFLDINMPDMSGISLAKAISNTTKIIFTTAYREYAIDGFDLQAVDYLLKPISLSRLAKAIQKFRTENKHSNWQKDYIIVRSERKMVKINFDEIVLIESLSDYLKIHTTKKIIVTRETISNIESKLPNKTFVRVHRSFIVAIPFINSYTSEYVEMKGKTISISRTYRDSFFKLMETE
ncbi:MAG: response regulator transcription factor [Lutibacter sp.]|uniref:LytR/AlgR family response regulator transcription factor n=1 Tax=Lutibacter sp. TaxID=1925666 RepID=UPI00299D187F|nr:response regulator transcription factor [Lutibacter sp.]MDX1828056.1 response regulator transcription factor [Lutibacter sp.]